MKFTFSIIFLLVLTILPMNVVAQKSHWYKSKKADKLRRFGKIDNAVKKYDDILKENPSNASANFQMGKIYLQDLEDFGKAERYLSTSIKNFGEKDTIYMAYFYLAETQKLLGNFPQAIENFEFFKSNGIKNESKAKNLIEDINQKIDECKLAEAYVKDSKYTFTRVINLGEKVNSNMSEYCSVFLPENQQLLYTARYQDSDNEKRFIDLKFYEGGYIISDTSDLVEGPTRVNFENTDKAHFSVVSKTYSGDTVIFYKDNKLWLSKMINNELTKPVVLPDSINRGFYQPHGVFSPDGKQFIFSSSDKKLQLDLYSIGINDDKSWGPVTLLSDKINTKHNEDSPFLSLDGKTLYFSSNKPGGYGNYDIYFSKMENGEWNESKNLGIPFNSGGEDIFFSLNADNKTGFLSSNRGGGFGSMDIYMFTEQPYPSFDCDEYLAENGNQGKNEIKILDELVVNEMVRFDVSRAKIEDAKITNIFWKVDDEILKLDNPTLAYTFADTGTHAIATQIYGKNKKTDEYAMDCSVKTFTINAEGPMFLEVETDRMVKVNTSTVVDAETFYLGENKKITDYKWFLDDEELDITKQSFVYAYTDTGYHDLKVLVTVNDKAKNESSELVSSKRIYVYDDDALAANGGAFDPAIDLYDNKNPETGKINALKADVYGIPDDSKVFYSWYIDNAEVKGRQTELLEYDFAPLSTITVKALVINDTDESDFTLEASKVIPPEFDNDGLAVNQNNADNTAGSENSNQANSDKNTGDGTQVDSSDPVAVDQITSNDQDGDNDQTGTTGQTGSDDNNNISDQDDAANKGNTDINDKADNGQIDASEYEIKPVYFLFDKYYLTSKAKSILNDNIQVLNANPSLAIVVEGNTDSMGPSSYNLRLSEKRAKEVYKYLKSKGVTDEQIHGINSNGEKLPKAPNSLNGKDNPKGRQENRRVDLTIVEK